VPRYFHKHLNYVERALKVFRAYRLGQRRGAPVVARAGACLVPAPAAAVEVVHPFASPSLLLLLLALLLLLLPRRRRRRRSCYRTGDLAARGSATGFRCRCPPRPRRAQPRGAGIRHGLSPTAPRPERRSGGEASGYRLRRGCTGLGFGPRRRMRWPAKTGAVVGDGESEEEAHGRRLGSTGNWGK
jgi:hypothetical protein